MGWSHRQCGVVLDKLYVPKLGGVSVVVMIFSLSVKYIKYTQIWTLGDRLIYNVGQTRQLLLSAALGASHQAAGGTLHHPDHVCHYRGSLHF